MTNPRRRHVMTLIIVGAVVAGCGGDDVKARADIAQISFRFQDSSVPPQYHRSWTLEIDASQVRVVVDSYGTVLSDVRRDLPKGLFDSLGPAPVASFTADQGCTGGTSRVVQLKSGDDVTSELFVESCGGQGSEQAEALDAWIAPVLENIEDWDRLRADDADPSTHQQITD